MSRFPRTLADAFPCERFPAVEVYRAPRWYWRALGWACTFGLLAFLGALLAWGGRQWP